MLIFKFEATSNSSLYLLYGTVIKNLRVSWFSTIRLFMSTKYDIRGVREFSGSIGLVNFFRVMMPQNILNSNHPSRAHGLGV